VGKRLSLFFCCIVVCQVAWALRDPTMPMTGAYGAHQATDPRVVTMILVSGERQLAVVGGSFVHVGDTVGDERVVAITPESVTLKNIESGQLTTNQVIVTDVKQYAP
jgi:hypothetical protein